MKIFWHSSSLIFDVSTYARLALCFEDIVVPDDDPGLYFPHSDLKKPDAPKDLLKYNKERIFWSSDAREAQAFYPYSAFGSWERAAENFGSDFADAQEEIVKVRNLKFDYFLQTAALNEGVLLGDTQLGESDFRIWLTSPDRDSSQLPLFPLVQALLTLAGVKIAVPNITVQHTDDLLRLRETYREEIQDYRAYIAELLVGSWEFIKSDPGYDEILRWSTHFAATKIAPSLRRLESAIQSGDKNLLARIGYGAIDVVPGIVAGQLKGNNLSLLSSALQGLLDVLAPNLARSLRERSALKSTFGLAYLYRLRKISEKGRKEK